MSMTYSDRLAALRAVLKKEGVDGFIVPRADEFRNNDEHVPERFERLRWLTGFTGSAGHAIILQDRAAVFSDGRYTIQLKSEVDPALYEVGDSTRISIPLWLEQNTLGDRVLGYDPRLHTSREIETLIQKGVRLSSFKHNPIDAIWTDQPAGPQSVIDPFSSDLAGKNVVEKLDAAAQVLKRGGHDAAILCLGDSIAWLLNIRADDIKNTPVPASYAILHNDGTLDWIIDPARVPDHVQLTFGNHVSLVPPEELENMLAALAGKTVALDERRTTAWFKDFLKEKAISCVDAKDPCIDLRARKNGAEQAAMRRAHIRDGIALVKFMKWMSESDCSNLTELDLVKALDEFRAVATEYRGVSFNTIAASGPNGAIVHYRPMVASNRPLDFNGLLLLDSGAQYIDGTTDVTRTLAVGQPTQEMRQRYTLVLKAHIAVASARFPVGTTGAQIDALARAPLWKHGLDYVHGTGHGVGVYLSVHEEAASLSPRGVDPVEAGMILSNEPGYYKEGAYGIRLENLVLAHEDGVCEATGKTMLAFESLTLAPFDRTLIVPDMLDRDEAAWLEAYHAKVFDVLSLSLDPETRQWLEAVISL